MLVIAKAGSSDILKPRLIKIILQINELLTDSEALQSIVKDKTSELCLVNVKERKRKYVELLNEFNYLQLAYSEFLPEIHYDPSAAIRLKPLIPELSLTVVKSPFSQKQSLVNYFLSQNISGLPSGLDGIVMTLAAYYEASYKPFVMELGLHPERGVILYGPPGTGKTVMAKAIAEYLGCSSNQIKITSGSNLLDKWLGNTEQNIRELFNDARSNPEHLYVIIIDEIEVILGRRDQAKASHERSQITQILTELDGIDSPKNIFVIGITKHLDLLDPAAIRPGRLGTLIEVQLPNVDQRVNIYELYLRRIRKEFLSEDYLVLAKELAQESSNFSGAEIKAAIQRTSNNSFMKIIQTRHFECKDSPKKEQLQISKEDFFETINLIKKQKAAESVK